MEEPTIAPADAIPSVPVAEVRDYRRINAELARLLDEGNPVVRLSGVGRQRLLAAGLSGPWSATVLVDGPAGPELGAGLDAPSLTILAPSADDGAGRGLKSGRIAVRGPVGDAVGYAQAGGILVVLGAAGHRAGLAMAGGVLILLDRSGRLCGDRQTGGRIFARSDQLGPDVARGRRGGRVVAIGPDGSIEDGEDARAFAEALRGIDAWASATPDLSKGGDS